MARKPYPSDVTDEEWSFVAPYLTLMREDAPQREHSLREAFNGLRYVVRGGQAWRMMPNDLPPWDIVYQQAQRWIKAGVFQAMVHDLRELLRMTQGRAPDLSRVVVDSSSVRAVHGGKKRGRARSTAARPAASTTWRSTPAASLWPAS
ncbi:MAG TPA: transposase [Tepidisphaeraceae bacterium]|jgi:transposase|nr:transposase [Tepidisphaeraceae bacterium]